MSPTFRAGGLASGMDTNGIIDQLVGLERRSLDSLKRRQSGLKTQVSVLGDLSSKLSSLSSAAKSLGDKGVLGVKATTTPTGFGATPSSSSQPGRYGVQVTQLAQAAKAQSQSFASSTAQVRGGTLGISVNGTAYSVTLSDGAALSDVALAINQSGAPVKAVVLDTGSGSYLSITNRDTGHTVGGNASDALVLTETSTGVLGQALSASIVTTASNSKVKVDGLTFERTSNEITDAIPGTNLSLKATTAAAEDLVLTSDVESTQKNLQKFADAYNDVLRVVQRELSVTKGTNRDASLAGDSAVRGLQKSLQGLLTQTVSGLGTVRTLADVGVKTGRDGSLSIDQSRLEKAMASDPSAVNALFSTATTGIAAAADTLADRYVDSVDGLITSRKSGLNKSISRIDDELVRAEARLETYRENLVKQFTAMEKVVSGMKSLGNYLSAQESAAARSGQ